jgi:hypothetical protein
MIVKSRISMACWQQRVERAHAEAKVMSRIAQRVEKGSSLNDAIAAEVAPARRSWIIHHWRAFLDLRWEALVDRRVPPQPRIPNDVALLVEGACESNPAITAAGVIEILARRRLKNLPSLSWIEKRMGRVEARQRYAEKKRRRAQRKVEELPLAGGALLLAAEVETQAIATLVDTVEAIAKEARDASVGRVPERDVANRDGNGHFTDAYNRERRRGEGEAIASYLRTAEEKAEGRVPSWPRFVHERRETLETKLATLTLSPLASATVGWDALRAVEAEGLSSLTGFAYMPSTLSKFTSALAVSGAGPRLLEAMGANWHRVAEERWGEPGAMAAFYVDNHVKEVWSSLFTLSGKVSRLNRVMPCITTTYIHTGAGCPIAAAVQSGSAPLAKRLVELVRTTEKRLGGDVERAVVIDSEGSTFDILQTFAEAKKVIVTPLRSSRVPELELAYSRGSRFRPYREKDELRIARAKLVHKSTGRSLEVGALIVRREHRELDSILLTTGLQLGFAGRDLADLYFARWPIQENAFKQGAVVNLDEHKGNCGRMVANIAVVTELEQLEHRMTRNEATHTSLLDEQKQLEERLKTAEHEHEQAAAALQSSSLKLDALLGERGQAQDDRAIAVASATHRSAARRTQEAAALENKTRARLEVNNKRAERIDAQQVKDAERRAKIEPRKTIRELDTALDSILTATKLTLSLLIAFVLREYIPEARVSPDTFASRIFGLRGRREVDDEEECIVFYENKRDPEINAAIAIACTRLNERQLIRGGRRLSYVLEPERPSGRG